MCGIFALLGLHQDELDLSLRKEAIRRRGPDGMEVVSFDHAMICASVLRMRRGSEWEQPAIDEKTGLVLAWNGEWYDQDHDGCDTYRVLELAVAATADCQDAERACTALTHAMRKMVQGEYALVCWLPRLQTLIFGRDPLGRRSLLWGYGKEDETLLAVASVGAVGNDEMKWQEVEPWNGLMAAQILADGRIQCIRSALVPTLRYTRRHKKDSGSNRRERAAAELLTALSEAVRIRVHGSRSTIGILFSGGLDSAVLAALAHKHAPPDEAIELINVAFGANRIDADRAPDRLAARRTLAELKASAPSRDWRLVEVSIDRLQLSRSARRVIALSRPNLTHMDFNIAAALRHAAHGVGTLYTSEKNEHHAPPATADEASVLRYASQAAVVTHAAVDTEKNQSTAPCKGIVPVGFGKPDKPCPNTASRRCGLCGNCCRRMQNVCGVHPPRRSAEEKRLRRDRKEEQERLSTKVMTPAESEHDTDAEGFLLTTQEYYVCTSRLLLLGMGADELLAGYSRHRTKYKHFGREALIAELDLDFNRIPQRNLGRDDRIISDAAREARFPFLDEGVVHLIRSTFEIEDIADLDLPPGVGCKRVLRDVARLLGLEHCATLQKRAIQFGTRIAPHSNKLAFGSNRQADGAAPFSIETMLASLSSSI